MQFNSHTNTLKACDLFCLKLKKYRSLLNRCQSVLCYQWMIFLSMCFCEYLPPRIWTSRLSTVPTRLRSLHLFKGYFRRKETVKMESWKGCHRRILPVHRGMHFMTVFLRRERIEHKTAIGKCEDHILLWRNRGPLHLKSEGMINTR